MALERHRGLLYHHLTEEMVSGEYGIPKSSDVFCSYCRNTLAWKLSGFDLAKCRSVIRPIIMPF
jgi:hypothetical protein